MEAISPAQRTKGVTGERCEGTGLHMGDPGMQEEERKELALNDLSEVSPEELDIVLEGYLTENPVW